MPSIARTFGLILVAVCPAGLAAQTFSPATQQPAWPPRPAAPAPVALPSYGSLPQRGVVSAVYEQPRSGPAPGTVEPGTLPAATALAPAGATSARPLPPASRSRTSQGPAAFKGLPSMATVGGSLAVVLGIFLLAAYGMRRLAPSAMTTLPRDAFEVLGRAPLAGRQQVHLLRCGRKLLLVSVTATGTETLTEVTDPLEVDRLLGLCEQVKPNSTTATFRQVFGQLNRDESASERFRGGSLDEVRLGRSGPTITDAPSENRHA